MLSGADSSCMSPLSAKPSTGIPLDCPLQLGLVFGSSLLFSVFAHASPSRPTGSRLSSPRRPSPMNSVALVRLGLVFRGGRLTELVGSFAPPFVKGLLGSFDGMFRGPRASVWMGVVGRSAGVARFPGEFLAHVQRSQSFDLADSANRRGREKVSTLPRIPQRSISAREALVANSSSSISVGLYIQTPLSAPSNSAAPDRRFLAHIIDGPQIPDEAQGLQNNENLAFALKVAPWQEIQAGSP